MPSIDNFSCHRCQQECTSKAGLTNHLKKCIPSVAETMSGSSGIAVVNKTKKDKETIKNKTIKKVDKK